MVALALTLGLLYVLIVFVIQPLLLRRRTGSSGWLHSLGATGWERVANLLFVLACGLDLAVPALALVGTVHPVSVPARPAVNAAAFAGFAASLVLVVSAQRVMGESWRTGIDLEHPSALVTGGPFRFIRNPTYTSLVTCSVALGMLVPTVLTPAAVSSCVLALQIQTRLVEEPHLRRVHGMSYQRYAAEVGRFLPALGRLRRVPPGAGQVS
jgi:protein-S-isoprenylcysteine O-methyltransferase Ste14